MKITLLMSILMLVFTVNLFAQYCEPTQVTLNNGSATVTGKTSGCNRFAFIIDEGQRVKASLTSTDSKARFNLQDGAEDETGSKVYSNLTSFDKFLTFGEFSIEVKGTASTSFTLKVTVTDE